MIVIIYPTLRQLFDFSGIKDISWLFHPFFLTGQIIWKKMHQVVSSASSRPPMAALSKLFFSKTMSKSSTAFTLFKLLVGLFHHLPFFSYLAFREQLEFWIWYSIRKSSGSQKAWRVQESVILAEESNGSVSKWGWQYSTHPVAKLYHRIYEKYLRYSKCVDISLQNINNHSNNYILDHIASCHLIYCIHGLVLCYLLLLITIEAPDSPTRKSIHDHWSFSQAPGREWKIRKPTERLNWLVFSGETMGNIWKLKAIESYIIGCFRNFELWSFETILFLPFQWNKIIHLTELVHPTLSRLEGTPGLPGSRLDACWANRN